ncbi:class I SAM-dependent methyltransferase [Candidatus Sulfurimonas marisnigri]|uniref:Class I SAM-dependent methyltransferase n=1 Tax=Candidatus Sulfurimonas marisnigri TaxID=2740405 RepID=A0A7S7M2J5_9BACT|nr:class I SAM-dependent methyltransferase [Candidatus Sulfurimonas marisnigri]QOY55760.1 class I SAM-dependent methyltransferase [Candidatus Sulfurimonas marisnigri]
MIPFNHLGFVFKYFGSVIYPKKVLEELCIFLEPLSNKASVLDVGAGTGMMSELAYRCNSELRYVAVDPANGMLKYAEDYVEIHIATAEVLPFDDDSFDAILMGESLHHFDDPDVAMKEVVRVLKKNGKLFIYDFDKGTFMGKSLWAMEKLLGEPAHFYEVHVLKKMLEGNGFTVEVSNHSWRYTVSATL